MRPSSVGSGSSRRSNYSRSFHLPDEESGFDYASSAAVGGTMLPIFLNDLIRPSSSSSNEDLVEVELQLEDDNIYICSVTPRAMTPRSARADHDAASSSASVSFGGGGGGGGGNGGGSGGLL